MSVFQPDEHERIEDTVILGYPAGKVETMITIEGVGYLDDVFYPLCADAVQTEILSGAGGVRVRPDTYTQRVVFD